MRGSALECPNLCAVPPSHPPWRLKSLGDIPDKNRVLKPLFAVNLDRGEVVAFKGVMSATVAPETACMQPQSSTEIHERQQEPRHDNNLYPFTASIIFGGGVSLTATLPQIDTTCAQTTASLARSLARSRKL